MAKNLSEELTDDEFRILLRIKDQEMIMMEKRGYDPSKIIPFIAGTAIQFEDKFNPFITGKINVKMMEDLRKNKGFFRHREDFSADYYIGNIKNPEKKAKVIYIDRKNGLDNQLPAGKQGVVKKSKQRNRDTGIEYINNAMAAIAEFEEGKVHNAGAMYDEIIIIVKKNLTHSAKIRIDSWLLNKSIFNDSYMLIPIFDHAFSPQFKIWKNDEEFQQDENIERKNLKPLLVEDAISKRLGLRSGNYLMTISASPLSGNEVHYFKVV